MKLEAWQKAERFIPLTYLESLQSRPMVVKLSDEWNFVTSPQKALTFIAFIDRKDFVIRLFDQFKGLPDATPADHVRRQVGMLTAIKAMVDLLFDVSKDEYAARETVAGRIWRALRRRPTRQQQYYAFLNTHLLENTDTMFDLWEKTLEMNTRLEKKNEVPGELCCSSKPRSLDKWRGFLHGRAGADAKTFLTLVHEDEEDTIRTIRQYRSQKEKNKEGGRMDAINRRMGRG